MYLSITEGEFSMASKPSDNAKTIENPTQSVVDLWFVAVVLAWIDGIFSFNRVSLEFIVNGSGDKGREQLLFVNVA